MQFVVPKLDLKFLKGTLLGCVTISSGYYAYVLNNRRKIRQKIAEKGNAERKLIDELKNETQLRYEANKEHYNFILTQTATQLVACMQDGKLDPEDVLVAYVYKALTVNEDLNCVTHVLREAFNFVKIIKGKPNKSMPLYGLPVSIKEQIALKGHASTFGVSKLLDVIQPEDCLVVATLKQCGAIPFVRTNLPQTVISFESSNPIFGETGNPHNKDFGPGGSSSGEGALIGGGGSPLGIGSDIGGSIRCPAHLCGICGLKPTKHRLSLKGMVAPFAGFTDISSSFGPMARDVDTLTLAMKSLLCDFMFKQDSNVPPLPFNDLVYESKRPLRIGYYFDNGYMQAVPACERAVEITKQHLEAAGHTLVKFDVPDVDLAMKLTLGAMLADGGEALSSYLKDDVVDKRIERFWKTLKMFRFLRWIMAKVIYGWYPRLAETLLLFDGAKSVHESRMLTQKIWVYQVGFGKEWNRHNLDAMICPSYPVAACPKGSFEDPCVTGSYTALYNLLNYPAGVVPVTKVNSSDIESLKTYKGHFDDPWDWHIKDISQHSLGMPVGVQCVAKPWNEEMCLRVMKEVESLVNE